MADITYIPIRQLYPHPDNPRKELGDLSELAASIKENGVYQNLTVIPGHYLNSREYIAKCVDEGGDAAAAAAAWTPKAAWSSEDYTIIIGHRRAAAAQQAGLYELPCAIVEMDEREQMGQFEPLTEDLVFDGEDKKQLYEKPYDIKPSAKTFCSCTRSATPSPRTPCPTSSTGVACSSRPTASLSRSTTRPCTRACCTETPKCVSCAFSGPPSTTTTTPASRRSRTMESIDVFAPLASLQWVDRNTIHANDYNPNKVSEENLKLLIQSILTNGWTLPIVVRPDGTIIDGFHRWTVSGREPLLSLLGGKVPVVVVDHHGDESADVYGTITHNRARGTHLLEPMKAIVKKLIDEGKTVEEIGKQLGMKPEEIFRLSGFTKDEFLNMMTKGHDTYSKAQVIRSV